MALSFKLVLGFKLTFKGTSFLFFIFNDSSDSDIISIVSSLTVSDVSVKSINSTSIEGFFFRLIISSFTCFIKFFSSKSLSFKLTVPVLTSSKPFIY